MENKLYVSPPPHIKSSNSTHSIMLDVVIALIPALIAAVIIFGPRALIMTAVCVASCMVFEYLFRRLTKKESTVGDLSAVVTGMLLAFNLPVTLPYWMAIIGCFTAIIVVKQLFGGIGHNFVNPALLGRIVLFISFSSQMAKWAVPFDYSLGTDAVTSATPLSGGDIPSYLNMFLGNMGGCIGETCTLALILGGIYLVIKKVINPVIPLTYLATVAVITLIAGADPLFHLLSGGLMLGAIFMATDYTTSPTTFWGKVIFAAGCGIVTSLIRLYGTYAEGVSFAIIFMNILVPYIEKATRPKVFGGAKV